MEDRQRVIFYSGHGVFFFVRTCPGSHTMEPSRYMLTPPHVVLSPPQAQQVLAELRCKLCQLPIIEDTDAALQALDAAPDDIVLIQRQTGPYFRRVVTSTKK